MNTPPGGGTAGPGLTSNVAGLLTYVLGLITGIIFLVLEPYKNDPFVRFHAFQSIFFNVAWIVFWVGFSIMSGILGYISFGIMSVMMTLVGLLVSLGAFIYWVFLMIQAYQNRIYRIPIIGDEAAKFASR